MTTETIGAWETGGNAGMRAAQELRRLSPGSQALRQGRRVRASSAHGNLGRSGVAGWEFAGAVPAGAWCRLDVWLAGRVVTAEARTGTRTGVWAAFATGAAA